MCIPENLSCWHVVSTFKSCFTFNYFFLNEPLPVFACKTLRTKPFSPGSLCAVSNLTITSKTKDQEVGQRHCFDYHGNLTTQQPAHSVQGSNQTAY